VVAHLGPFPASTDALPCALWIFPTGFSHRLEGVRTHSFQLLSFSFLLPDAQGVPVPNQAHADLVSLHLFISLVYRFPSVSPAQESCRLFPQRLLADFSFSTHRLLLLIRFWFRLSARGAPRPHLIPATALVRAAVRPCVPCPRHRLRA
jgi:hypothetical protein